MINIPLQLENIYVNQTFSNQQEFFETITNKLKEKGLIKDGYYEAINSRENKYPTGLDSGLLKVAIPHTDYEYSNTTDLIVTTLEKPIIFNAMDNPDLEIEVDIIILILFDNPEKQLELLTNIMKIIQNQELLKEISNATTSQEVYQLLTKK